MIGQSPASAVPPGHWVVFGTALGIMMEREDAPDDAQDRTPMMRVLVRRAGGASAPADEVTSLGGNEIVTDLGPVQAPVTVEV